jgi:hypothetical protein
MNDHTFSITDNLIEPKSIFFLFSFFPFFPFFSFFSFPSLSLFSPTRDYFLFSSFIFPLCSPGDNTYSQFLSSLLISVNHSTLPHLSFSFPCAKTEGPLTLSVKEPHSFHFFHLHRELSSSLSSSLSFF